MEPRKRRRLCIEAEQELVKYRSMLVLQLQNVNRALELTAAVRSSQHLTNESGATPLASASEDSEATASHASADCHASAGCHASADCHASVDAMPSSSTRDKVHRTSSLGRATRAANRQSGGNEPGESLSTFPSSSDGGSDGRHRNGSDQSYSPQSQMPQHPHDEPLCAPRGCIVTNPQPPHAHGPHAHMPHTEQSYYFLAPVDSPAVHQHALVYPGYPPTGPPPPPCAAVHPSHGAMLVSCLPPEHGHTAHTPAPMCIQQPHVYTAPTANACPQQLHDYPRSAFRAAPARLASACICVQTAQEPPLVTPGPFVELPMGVRQSADSTLRAPYEHD